MKKQSMYRIAAILLFAVIAMAVPQFAQAANTAAGVSISNQATVDYTVGTVPQATVPGNTVTFLVDRVIYLTVTPLGSTVTSAPSSTFQAIQFLVSNTSNTAMRFALSPVSKLSNTWTLTTPNIYRDNNSSGSWDAGDTLYANAGTFGDIASGASVTVLIVGDIPGALTNGAAAVYDLLAQAVDANTTNLSIATPAGTTKTGINLNAVLTIFGDAAGSAVGDGARDGKHSASGTFTITAAGLTVSKTATVYWDPVNLLVEPKAIPGAVITYTVTVTNAAVAAIATNVAITDDLSTMINAPNGYFAFRTAYDDGAAPSPCGAGSGIVVNNACKTNVAGDDGNSADFTSNKVTVSGLTIAAGGTATIKYQVVIQ